ncbi:helix-turn-helix transcriptional regulator [Nocardia cyriacigeorgica]|uniref:helix-turn-helix domain-containing protein n=1 Tax=Nocardia TaxID=1817 RepID=UPI001893D58A|nr:MULTISPECIES: helix-turn-helix transcriptional regulator [Nocardia]MBF6100580.1 helix-turn-helix transcriptional regulator [Nocardia cyriacigeorgica]
MDITEEAINRFYIELGTRIRNARTPKKISQQELGEAVGLKRSSIANIEAGRQRSAVHIIALIGQALSISPEELFPRIKDSESLSDIEITRNDIEGQSVDTQEFIASAMRRAMGG